MNIFIITFYSKIKSDDVNPKILKAFLNIYIINLFFGITWSICELIITKNILESFRHFLFYYTVPLGVLSFLHVKRQYLIRSLGVIALVVSSSCIIQFFICNIFPGEIIGSAIIKPYLNLINPANIGETSLPRIGLLYRAHGITGNYHDSANILVMLGVFFISSLINGEIKFSRIFISIIIILGILATLSLANIIIFFAVLIFLVFNSTSRLKTSALFLVLVFISFLSISYTSLESHKFSEVFNQLDPQGEKNFKGCSMLVKVQKQSK